MVRLVSLSRSVLIVASGLDAQSIPVAMESCAINVDIISISISISISITRCMDA